MAELAVDPATFQRLHPAAYQQRFLRAGVRADGRGVRDSRPLGLHPGAVSQGTTHGSCLCKLGNTTLLCGLRAEVAKPTLAEPCTGFLVVNLDIPPMAHASAEPGAPSDWTQSASVLLHDIFQDVVDRRALCIQPGTAVWCLYADMVVLNQEGGVLDAACAALMGALEHARIPLVRYDEVQECVQLEEPTTMVPLPLHHHLSALTIGMVEEGADSPLLVDPSIEEEVCLTTSVTVFVDTHTHHVHGVHKPGGAAIDAGTLAECMELAFALR